MAGTARFRISVITAERAGSLVWLIASIQGKQVENRYHILTRDLVARAA